MRVGEAVRTRLTSLEHQEAYLKTYQSPLCGQSPANAERQAIAETLNVLVDARIKDRRIGNGDAIAHPAPASISPDRLADITNRTVSSAEAR